MRVSRPLGLVVGALTLWPVIYLFYFMAFISSFMRSVGGRSEPDAASSFQRLEVAHCGTMAVIFGLLIFYIVHLFKNESVLGSKKTLWAVVLLFGNVIAMPVYWFLYIWRSPAPVVPPGRVSRGGAA